MHTTITHDPPNRLVVRRDLVAISEGPNGCGFSGGCPAQLYLKARAVSARRSRQIGERPVGKWAWMCAGSRPLEPAAAGRGDAVPTSYRYVFNCPYIQHRPWPPRHPLRFSWMGCCLFQRPAPRSSPCHQTFLLYARSSFGDYCQLAVLTVIGNPGVLKHLFWSAGI